MKTTLTNEEIYVNSLSYETVLKGLPDLPIQVYFYILKNYDTIKSLYSAIDQSKNKIVITYGEAVDEAAGKYHICQEKVPVAQKELDDLMGLKQEIEYTPIKLSTLKDVTISASCMRHLMWMIEDDLKEE